MYKDQVKINSVLFGKHEFCQFALFLFVRFRIRLFSFIDSLKHTNQPISSFDERHREISTIWIVFVCKRRSTKSNTT